MSVSFRTKIDLPTIAATAAYLEKNGWRRVESKNPNALVFHGPNDIYGTPLIVVLPAHKTLIDADLRLNDAMRTLAVLNATSPEQMARKITLQNAHSVSTNKTRLAPKKRTALETGPKPTVPAGV